MENTDPTRQMDAAIVAPQRTSDVADMQVQAEARKLAAQPTTDKPSVAELIAAATTAKIKEIENIDLGLPEFRESSAAEKQQADQLLRDANLARRREKYREAEAKCLEALQHVPKDSAALELYGDLLQGIAEVDKALAAYKRALLADPNRSSAERKYADLMMRQQNWGGIDMEAVQKSPWIAPIFSLMLPGSGQIINGETLKGIVIMLATAVCLFWWSLASNEPPTVSKSGTASVSASSKHGTFNKGVMLPILAGSALYIYAVADANVKSRGTGGGKRSKASPIDKSGWEV